MSEQQPEELSTHNERQATVLLVDDETGHLQSLKILFERAQLQSKAGENYRLEVLTASSGTLALELVRQRPVDIILTDLMMPQMSGKDLLLNAKAIGADADVIVMTAFGTVENAVDAMRVGAYDFIQKPFKSALVLKVIERCLEKRLLKEENLLLRRTLVGLNPNSVKEKTIVGRSPAMAQLMETVQQVADSSASVLLYGESGTGKEIIAKAIHEHSPRMEKPLVTVNCAALPESILEAELFGYEKGAFTGATENKKGRLDRADGGTLFLDEIGDLSASVQVKLLRVLQEGEFDRVGGTEPIQVDFRLVAATNRNLQQMVHDGQFREDLFYRLNVIALELPPMRERPEDIPLLVSYFVQKYSQKNNRSIERVSEEAMQVFRRYSWPGNVREIENIIERAVVLAKDAEIQISDLPSSLLSSSSPRPSSIRRDGDIVLIPIGTKLADAELALIKETLGKTNGDKSMAAQLLGIAARTIYRKLDSDT